MLKPLLKRNLRRIRVVPYPLPIRVIELHFNGTAGLAYEVILQLHIYIQLCVLVCVIQFGSNEEVGDMQRRSRVQIDFAKNAAEPPEVLILQPAGVAPAIHFYGQLVLSSDEIGGNIKFRRRKRIFAITDELPVYPYIES
ncbi:hypothetical protein D3C77_501700 [compost metagenome]